MEYKLLARSFGTVLLVCGLPFTLNKVTSYVTQKDLFSLVEKSPETNNGQTNIKQSKLYRQEALQHYSFLFLYCVALLVSLAVFLPISFITRCILALEAALYFAIAARQPFSTTPYTCIAVVWLVLVTCYGFWRIRTRTLFDTKIKPRTQIKPAPKKSISILVNLLSVVIFVTAPLSLMLISKNSYTVLTNVGAVDKNIRTLGATKEAYKTHPAHAKQWRALSRKLDFFAFMLWTLLALSFVTFLPVHPLAQCALWTEFFFLLTVGSYTGAVPNVSGASYLLFALFTFLLTATVYRYRIKHPD